MKKFYALLLLSATVLLNGCGGTMFTSYPNKIQPLTHALSTGAPLNFDQILVDETKGSDLILYNMERGRVAHIAGKQEVSMSDFRASLDKMEDNDKKAIVSASNVAQNVGSAFTNDNAIAYEGEGYERVMVHHYQALNYLKKKNLEGAGVEVRRANFEQEESLKRFEKEVEKAQKAAEEKKVDGKSMSNVDKQYAQMDEVAGKVKNSFQNAYTFYISGLIYELLNQKNDAYIDYKKALEIYPDNHYLQKDVVRLAATLNMGDDLAALQKRFKISPEKNGSAGDESGELLVLFEDGLAPQKHEVKISLAIPKAGLVSIAFPIYKEKWTPQYPINVSVDNSSVGVTEPICDIRALAVKALQEKAAVIATRQIVRAITKGVTNKLAKDKLGFGGELAMSLINTATENADLRSWLTLPSNAQILRIPLSAGKHKIAIKHTNNRFAAADVDIKAKGKTVLQVVRIGDKFYTSSTSF